MQYADIQPFFDGTPLIYLATIENMGESYQPRVRAMSLIHFEEQLWCCSSPSRSKIAQLLENNHFEFCLLRSANQEFHNIIYKK